MSSRVCVIAEAGVNHNGSLECAHKLVEAAADAGADAVKFQSFRTGDAISRRAPKADYQVQHTGSDETQFEMVSKLELSEAAHFELQAHCRERAIEFLSTPFDLWSLDLLVNKCGLARLKIASGEITNAPLLLRVAELTKPVILSTGMSTLGDVESALGVLAFGYLGSTATPGAAAFSDAYCSAAGRGALEAHVTLLHCTTEYPAPYEEVNLRAMDTLACAFGLPVGFSDHTCGLAVCIAAVARGATVIEKHFTLDRALPGPDHKASIEPDGLRELVQSIRQVEQALGHAAKIPAASEVRNMKVARKSLVAARAIKKGESFTAENLVVKRPGTGLSPMRYWEIVGTLARRDYVAEEAVE